MSLFPIVARACWRTDPHDPHTWMRYEEYGEAEYSGGGGVQHACPGREEHMAPIRTPEKHRTPSQRRRDRATAFHVETRDGKHVLVSPDRRVVITEFLFGGKRIPVNADGTFTVTV